MNDKVWITIGGIFGFLAVSIGAFGSHGLREQVSADLMKTFETGVLYHLVHSVVIVAIAVNSKRNFTFPLVFFSIGIFLFSFSLYTYVITGIKSLAMITPFGGVSFIIGWLSLIRIALKRVNTITEKK